MYSAGSIGLNLNVQNGKLQNAWTILLPWPCVYTIIFSSIALLCTDVHYVLYWEKFSSSGCLCGGCTQINSIFLFSLTGAKLPDPACYGHTQFHLVPDRYRRDRMAKQQQSDQAEVFLRANGLASLFAWTGAQAMYQGELSAQRTDMKCDHRGAYLYLNPLQVSGTTRMSPGLSSPRLWSQTASTSPSSATSSTQWPCLWRKTEATPGKTSCGAPRACDCTTPCRMARCLVWTTVSSSFWFSSSWTGHRILQVCVFKNRLGMIPLESLFSITLKEART